MNLYTPLIKRVSFGKVSFRLHTSFRTVLQCYAVFEDDLLTDYEKVDVCLTLLVRRKFLLRFFLPIKSLRCFIKFSSNSLRFPGKRRNRDKNSLTLLRMPHPSTPHFGSAITLI